MIVAFDLAWSGATGWCVYDSDAENPFISTGEFTPKKAKDTISVAVDIFNGVSNVVSRFDGPMIVAYEITDWHRTLKGRNFARDYKIERQAQRCLGRAETALMLAAYGFMPDKVVKLVPVGANEAKREFGAVRKDACATLLAQEYPNRFERQDKKASYLYDKWFKCDVSHHVSDAFVIASVVARRERQAEAYSKHA